MKFKGNYGIIIISINLDNRGHCHATSYKKHVLNGEFELVRQLMSETDFMEFEEAYISVLMK